MRAMNKPNFFIVGAPKCGTSSMVEYLSQHPDIFMPEERTTTGKKELHFFGADLGSLAIPQNEKQYLKFFAKATTEKKIGEASTGYLYSRDAAREIFEFNPSSQIIIMLRNPTDMLYSLHSQKLYNGTENIRNFEEALDAEEDRRKGRRIPRLCRFPKGLLYTEVVKYTEQVERYMEVFGREKVMVIIFDDFVSDTAGVYKETLEFLGVDANFSLPTYQTFNPNTVPRSKVLTTTINIISYFSHNFFRPLPPPCLLPLYICQSLE